MEENRRSYTLTELSAPQETRIFSQGLTAKCWISPWWVVALQMGFSCLVSNNLIFVLSCSVVPVAKVPSNIIVVVFIIWFFSSKKLIIEKGGSRTSDGKDCGGRNIGLRLFVVKEAPKLLDIAHEHLWFLGFRPLWNPVSRCNKVVWGAKGDIIGSWPTKFLIPDG